MFLLLYANSEASTQKDQFIYLASKYKSQSDDLFVCWKFNALLKQAENKGGNTCENYKIVAFSDFIFELALVDQGFEGFPYSWNNRNAGDDNIHEQLD